MITEEQASQPARYSVIYIGEPNAELNSNLCPAPNERTLIESREGAEPKLSHRSVPSNRATGKLLWPSGWLRLVPTPR